jgi:hypothetical protein
MDIIKKTQKKYTFINIYKNITKTSQKHHTNSTKTLLHKPDYPDMYIYIHIIVKPKT